MIYSILYEFEGMECSLSRNEIQKRNMEETTDPIRGPYTHVSTIYYIKHYDNPDSALY